MVGVNTTAGTILWTFSGLGVPSNETTQALFVPGVAGTGGRVVVVTGSLIACIDALTGECHWRADLGSGSQVQSFLFGNSPTESDPDLQWLAVNVGTWMTNQLALAVYVFQL
jgi:hypothetical protein